MKTSYQIIEEHKNESIKPYHYLFHYIKLNTKFLDLKELQLKKEDTTVLFNKLKGYKYVDEMSDLKYGAHIRWIPIDNPTNINLKQGAIFCEMKIKVEGVYCLCKNYGYKPRHFQLSFDKNLIFQKLTDQELVLLSALDHLSK